MQSLTVAALLAVQAAFAYPEHGHHAHHHARREALAQPDYITAVINGKTVSWAAPGATGAPAAVNYNAGAPAPAPAPAPASSDSSSTNLGYMTGGNSGSGAIQKVASVDGHAYTMTLKSTAATSRKVFVWNKVGPDGQPNSGATCGKPTLEIDLAAGATQVLAFEANTQGALCDFTEGFLSPTSNIFVCPYVEFNYAPNTGNGPGWSAYDVSTIQQGLHNNGGGKCNLQVSAPGTAASVSTCSENMYYSASQPDGIGGTVSTTQEAHFLTTLCD